MDQTGAQTLDIAPACAMPSLRKESSQGGLQTPPSSPDEPKAGLEQSRYRVQLPSFLRRTHPNPSPTDFTHHRSRNEALEHLTGGKAQGTSKTMPHSPFRAVQHMKEPFPLVLPASLAPSTRSCGEKSSAQRLGAVPLSYRDLRAVRSEHRLEVKASTSIALLPSPVFSDLQIGHISDSYFTGCDSDKGPLPQTKDDGGASPYESHNILSAYCDDHQIRSSEPSSEAARDVQSDQIVPEIIGQPERRRDVGIVFAPLSFPRHLQYSQRDRSKTCSSEADWLAGNMSVWLEGLPRADVQDVQRCASTIDGQDVIDEHQIVG